MKPKPLFLAATVAALLGWLAAPDRSRGQADADATATAALLAEVSAQQAVIADHHTKIDDKLAAISEEVRLARIYASRGGGKAK